MSMTFNETPTRCGNCVSIIHSDKPTIAILNGEKVYVCDNCIEELHSLSKQGDGEMSIDIKNPITPENHNKILGKVHDAYIKNKFDMCKGKKHAQEIMRKILQEDIQQLVDYALQHLDNIHHGDDDRNSDLYRFG